VVFHENENNDGTMNDTSVWHISNENDDHVRIDAVVEQ
jgi:hypothetical protein